MRCWVVVVSMLFAVAGTRTARAEDSTDPPESSFTKERVAQGKELAKNQQFGEALRAFKDAAALQPIPLHHCYVALTYFKLKRWPEAMLALERALADDGVAPRWCAKRLAGDLGAGLTVGSFAEVDLSSQPRGATVTVSSLDPDEVLTTPRRLWLAFGTHRIQVDHPGYASQEVDIQVTGKQLMPVDIAMVATDSVGVVPPPGPVPAVRAPSLTAEPAADDRGVGRRGRTWGWVTLSAGALAVVAGGVFHAEALATKHDAEALYQGPDFDGQLSTFERERAIAIGGYAIGAIGVGAGLYLLLRRDSQPARRRFSIDVAGDRIAVGWSGSL